jgi:hypothetical protein
MLVDSVRSVGHRATGDQLRRQQPSAREARGTRSCAAARVLPIARAPRHGVSSSFFMKFS